MAEYHRHKTYQKLSDMVHFLLLEFSLQRLMYRFPSGITVK